MVLCQGVWFYKEPLTFMERFHFTKGSLKWKKMSLVYKNVCYGTKKYGVPIKQ